MTPHHSDSAEPEPIAAAGEADRGDDSLSQFSQNRIGNVARLAKLIGWGMVQSENAHIETTQAFAATQAGQPAPAGPDPGIKYHRAVCGVTHVMRLQDRLEESFAIPERSEMDRARDAARAIRRHKEDQRSEIRHKLDATLPNIRRSEAMRVRRDIEEALASDEVDAMLETCSVPHIVLAICGGLGLAPDLSKWTDAELGYVHTPRPHQKSDTNWIPVVNARGMTNYFAGPPLETKVESEPCGTPYGFDEVGRGK